MKYMENPDIAFKSIDRVRRSHSLYAELAAETGIVGILLFFAIVVTMATRLWRLRARFKRRDPELSNLAAAFWLGLMGYLGTAVFLQLAYQRYFWLFLALAGATVQILGAELRRQLLQEKQR
jgi:O-antigen ligase